MSTIASPITGLNHVKIISSTPVDTIIELYKKELNIDVHRFFKGIADVLVCQCNDTGFRFYYPQDIDGDENFYNDLKRQLPKLYNSPYYSEDKWEYNICEGFISIQDKVYEIGAGSGAFLNKLRQKGVTRVSGSELNYESIESALKRGIELEHITIEEKGINVSEEYDIVCAFQVLEHVSNIRSFLKGSLSILKSGGKFIIAVPYNHPYLFKNDRLNTLNLPPHHMGLWNAQVFRSLEKVYPIELTTLIVESLPNSGYDFDRYYQINKDTLYPSNFPFKRTFDKLYLRFLKKFHYRKKGKNIVAVFTKK